MSGCDALTALALVLPVATAFLGFWYSHRLESERQDKRRKQELADRRRETKRRVLEELQRALAGVNEGSGTAALLAGVPQATGIEAGKAALQETWFRDWQEAGKQLTIYASRVDDPELAELARSIGISREDMREARGDRAKVTALRDKLTEEYEEANAIVGRLIRELDASDPQ